MLTSRLAAMSGSKPTTANSVVPMAKVAKKSANSSGDMDGPPYFNPCEAER